MLTSPGELGSRWWALAVATMTVICTVILVTSAPTSPRLWIGLAVLAAFVASFAFFGRRVGVGTPHAVAFVAICALATGALVSLVPLLAVFQSVGMPIAWVLGATRRAGILGNLAVALATTVGFFVSQGVTVDAATTAGISFAFSFGGSVVLGLWIWSIGEIGNERARLLDELTAAQDQLRVLHRDAGVTAERERIARELHDTIAQSLAGVVMLSQRARRDLAAGRLSDAALETLEDAARAALTETRVLVAGSAPVELGGGLPDALGKLVERFRRESGIAVDLDVELVDRLDRDAEVVLLRCAQEGLANVRKHAGASAVRVRLTDAGEGVELSVADDGRGLDSAAVPDGFGLSGLRARLAIAGGTLDVDGRPGGTTLTARLPRGESS